MSENKQGAAGQTANDSGELQALTPEAIDKLVVDKVNAAIAGHLTRFKGSFSKDIEGMVGKAVSPISEQIASLTKPPAEDDHKAKTAAEKASEIAAAKYADEVAKMKKELEAERRAREQEKATRLMQEERTALSSALTSEGCTGSYLKGAMALLNEEKRVIRGENGQIGMVVKRGSAPNTYDEFVPLEEGIKEWLKTEDGKAFLPARGSSGADARVSRAPGAKVSREDVMREAIARLPGAMAAHIAGK